MNRLDTKLHPNCDVANTEPDAGDLSILGPSWDGMSLEQRRLYGGPLTLAREAAEAAAIGEPVATLGEVLQLVDFAMRFPDGVFHHGLVPVAQACLASPRIIALATMVEQFAAREQDAEDDTDAPALDDVTERRVIQFARSIGYGLSHDREGAARRFAAFLADECRLSQSAALVFLSTWNAHNAPPLTDDELTACLTDEWATGAAHAGAA